MNALTNTERLRAGAVALRSLGRPGDEHAARMLELCAPIATHWTEPYAAPFVPLLESALRLAKAVMCSVDETELRAPIRPASSDPDFSLGLPGFAVNFVGSADD